MARYLDPKNDLTFKRVFGEHSHLCKSLLNSMLPLEGDRKIVSLEYLPAEMTPEIPEKKNSVVDVRCKDGTGRQFIVEMQMFWTDSFTSRVLLNASKAYVKQLNRGEGYSFLQPVYALGFVNEVFAPSIPDYYHHYRIVNIKNTEQRIKGLEFVFIELPKFKPGNLGERKLHELWLRFLTEIRENTQKAPDELIQDSATNEALRYLEEGAYSEAELYAYDKYWDAVMVEKDIRHDSLLMGRAEGEAERLVLAQEKAALEQEKAAIETAFEKEKAEREALQARIAELERLIKK